MTDWCETAGSCFLKESSQNQGLQDFKTEFSYQIYTNFLGFWAVTWLVEKIVKYDLVNRT